MPDDDPRFYALEVYWEANQDSIGNHSELIGGVGFRTFYETADEFLNALVENAETND